MLCMKPKRAKNIMPNTLQKKKILKVCVSSKPLCNRRLKPKDLF